MATETSADTKPKGGRFTFTRIALVSILAGGWLLIWLDQPGALTKTKIHPGSPHPEVSLVEWTSKLPWGSHRDAVVAAGETLWQQKHDPQVPLILFTAFGTNGERAVRLSKSFGDTGPFETIGYAQRIPGEARWRWLNEEESRALESAAAARSADDTPSGSLRSASPESNR